MYRCMSVIQQICHPCFNKKTGRLYHSRLLYLLFPKSNVEWNNLTLMKTVFGDWRVNVRHKSIRFVWIHGTKQIKFHRQHILLDETTLSGTFFIPQHFADPISTHFLLQEAYNVATFNIILKSTLQAHIQNFYMIARLRITYIL